MSRTLPKFSTTASIGTRWNLCAEQCEDTDKRFFAPPDRFSCSPGTPFLIPTRAPYDPPNIQPPKPIDGYICTAEGSVKMVSIDDGPPVTQAATFDLNDVLDRDAPTTERAEEYTIPPGQLASPDLFKCHLIPNLPSTSSADDLDHQIDVLSTPGPPTTSAASSPKTSRLVSSQCTSSCPLMSMR